MKTRSQDYSKIVFEQISALELPKDKQKIYGSLCHTFPLMVMRSGLSQSVAFVLVKAKLQDRLEDRHKESMPHKVFLENLASLSGLLLDEGRVPRKFQEKTHELELFEYMRITRKILAASIWYKRFAESLLGVEAGEDTGNEVDGDNTEEGEANDN